MKLATYMVTALALASALAVVSPAAAATAPCNDIAEGRCKIQLSTGITMAYVETGPETGQPVILLHGFTDSIRAWSSAMRALHKNDPDLRVLAVDLRGHGATDMPPGTSCAPAPERCFRPADLAEDVVAFMKAKGINKATLVGHSYGSFVVQEISLTHPAMVDRAILVATTTKGVGNPVIRDYVLNEPVEGSWKKALEARGKRYPDDFYELTPTDADPRAEEWVSKNWAVDPAADPATLVPLIPETSHVRLGTWIGVAKNVLVLDNTDRLRNLAVPALVIWGTQDNILPDEPDQKAVKQALEAATKAHGTVAYWKQYGVLPLPPSGAQETDVGHSAQWDAPEAMAADIDSFVRTGAPTKDLPHSDKAPNVNHMVLEPGKAIVQRFGAQS